MDLSYFIYTIVTFSMGVYFAGMFTTQKILFDFKHKQFYIESGDKKLYLARVKLNERCSVYINDVEYPTRGGYVFGLPYVAMENLTLKSARRDFEDTRIFTAGDLIYLAS